MTSTNEIINTADGLIPADYEGAATSSLKLITRIPYANTRIRIKNMGGGELIWGFSDTTTDLIKPMILLEGNECIIESTSIALPGDKLLVKVGPGSLFTGIGYKLWINE